MQHDDYRLALKDPFNGPSEEYIPYNVARSSTGNTESLYIYSPYEISKVYTEYIRMPQRVSYGSYQYVDGNIYPEQTLQTAEQTHSEIVDIACMLAGLNAQNPEYIQLKANKLSIHE